MKEISIEKLQVNPMTMFGRDWCLICAGNEQNGFNAMTVAWLRKEALGLYLK